MIVKMTEWLCWVFGIMMLGVFCAAHLETHSFQSAEKSQFERDQNSTPTNSSTGSKPISTGAIVGRLEVPRIHLSAMVVEGDDEATLRNAVGHIPGTALPGESGNIGLAAHRDTFFRGLSKVRDGDVVVLTTQGGIYLYHVAKGRVVKPEDTDVLRPLPKPALTLVTCYPFHYIGPAPDRYVVTAMETSLLSASY